MNHAKNYLNVFGEFEFEKKLTKKARNQKIRDTGYEGETYKELVRKGKKIGPCLAWVVEEKDGELSLCDRGEPHINM